MPLTLECACPDDGDVAVCELVELWWEGSSRYDSRGGINALNSLVLFNGASGVSFRSNTGTGEFSESLPLSLAADWSNLYVRVNIDSSANQPAAAGAGAFYELSWWIRAVYECARPGSAETTRYEIKLFEGGTVDEKNWAVLDVSLRSYLHGANSSALGVLYSSVSLGDNGVSGDFGEFDPLPGATIDLSSSGTVCLCPVGGVAPYYFAALAPLPDGLTLNMSTGCITGTRTDKGSTRNVTFQVSDGNSDVAQVTCSFLAVCGGGAVANGFF